LGNLYLISAILLIPIVQVTIKHDHLFDLFLELDHCLHPHVVVAEEVRSLHIVHDLVRTLEGDHLQALELVELLVTAPLHDALDVLLHGEVEVVGV
jgi:cobalamin biosynthesis Co2+ chelatase CbiK